MREFHLKLNNMVDKMKKVMHEWKHGELHSSSKEGPVVHDRKQAIAIGMSEARHAKSKALKHKKKFTPAERKQRMKEVHEKWYER